MHIAIFPTWQCQLACVYCSVRHSKINMDVAPEAWQTWARMLPLAVPPGTLIDIAGGEPFLFEGLIDLVHVLAGKGMRWAVTTNAKATEAIERLCREGAGGCACINVSDHAGNPEAHENIAKMRKAGFIVNVHRVDHRGAGKHEDDASLITYQDWKGGRAVDGKKRECTAGIHHWIAGPNGDVWRCIVAAQTGQPPFANLFTREMVPISAICDFGCSTCYTEDPESWEVQMREVGVNALSLPH